MAHDFIWSVRSSLNIYERLVLKCLFLLSTSSSSTSRYYFTFS